jgi:hypothetical protein
MSIKDKCVMRQLIWPICWPISPDPEQA